MKLRSILMAGVCVGALASCGDYVLPERDEADKFRLAENNPHPDAVEVLDELSALITAENRRRSATTQGPITQDQAVVGIVSTVEADPEAATRAEPDFFATLLVGVDERVEVPPQSTEQINAAARAVNVARANTEAAEAARAAASAAELARLNEANRIRHEQLTDRFADSLPLVVAGTEGPPDAIPGQCYAQVDQPARFETVAEQVLDKPATERVEVTEAVYATELRPVVVEEAFTRIEVIPATYETVVEDVVIQPERQVPVTVPAQFRTVVERVPVRPSFRAWEQCDRIYPVGTVVRNGTVLGSRTTASGTIECLLQFPATFREESREEMISPETTRLETVPAVTEQRVVRRVAEPSRSREVLVPAVVEMVETQVVVTPERIERIAVPPTFRTVERNVQRQAARQVWAPVICDTDQTGELITQVQSALAERGLYTARVDGVMGPQTRAAVQAFQFDQLDLRTSVLTVAGAQRLGALN